MQVGLGEMKPNRYFLLLLNTAVFNILLGGGGRAEVFHLIQVKLDFELCH